MTNVETEILTEAKAYAKAFFEKHISPKFAYHNWEHACDVVASAKDLAKGYDLSQEDWEILMLAAWFHDLGYEKGRIGHEERSCELARQFLQERDYPADSTDEVVYCIRATKMPHDPKNLLQELLCDADLSHLGSKTYWDRCGRVRLELAQTQNWVMSDHDWADFELAFIMDHEYHTEIGRALYQKRKEKHIRQLKKYKLRLNPEMADLIEEIERGEKLKKKKGKKKKKLKKLAQLEDGNHELKQLNLGRGVETMYRTTYRTHINLSSIADNKANIMLTVNAIVISIVTAELVPNFGDNPRLIFPTITLLSVCLATLVFAILATRPKVTKGEFNRDDIENKRSNLLFFGNFYNMDIEDFHWGMMEMIKDSDFLYSSMTRDLYYLGVVLAKKYRYLRIGYNIFMYGLIISVAIFAISFLTKA